MYRASKKRNLRDIPLLVNFLTKSFEKICVKSKCFLPNFWDELMSFFAEKPPPLLAEKMPFSVFGIWCFLCILLRSSLGTSSFKIYTSISKVLICSVLRSWTLEVKNEPKNMSYYQSGKFQNSNF